MPRKHPPVLQQNPDATPEDVAKALLQRVKPHKKSLRPKDKLQASRPPPASPPAIGHPQYVNHCI